MQKINAAAPQNIFPDKRNGRSLGGFARDSRETAKRAIKTLV
jgi:hypothetical protein